MTCELGHRWQKANKGYAAHDPYHDAPKPKKTEEIIRNKKVTLVVNAVTIIGRFSILAYFLMDNLSSDTPSRRVTMGLLFIDWVICYSY
jgi:hypothetical protein